MYKIKETIVVEGIYDKIKLSRFIDAVIIVTNGFCVFSDDRILESIKKMADETGIVILTDSDSAGFKIRNYIKQSLPKEKVKHAYVPDVHGKEKRKREPGKEGLLGVEGIKGIGSGEKRNALAHSLGIPMKISANMLLDLLNRLLNYDEFCEIVQNIDDLKGEI